MLLTGYKLAFLQAIFFLVHQFVNQLTVEWVNYLEVIINLIKSINNNSVKAAFTVQIFEIFLCPTTKHLNCIIKFVFLDKITTLSVPAQKLIKD